jgi:serine/threonine-protein kinase
MWKFRAHPNIVKLYGWSSAPAAIIMHRYNCGDLYNFLNGKVKGFTHSKSMMTQILPQITSAVAEMHRQNVVHCDLKPANILIERTADNQIHAVVSDLGIARILNTEDLQVRAFVIANIHGLSMQFASPEAITRFRNRYRETNYQVWKAGDAYSLAIIIYEMLLRRNVWS